MDTMKVTTKLAARGICGMINCGTCNEIFGTDDGCPYNLDVPDKDFLNFVDRVMHKLREKDEVSPVTEDDLIDILSEEL